MKKVTLLITMVAIPLIAFGSNKEEIFEALGIDGPERESKALDVDLYESTKGKEIYRSFVSYFESQREPIEFHDLKEINPSTINYQSNFLRKFYKDLIEEEDQKEKFLLNLKKWKTQTLSDLLLKMGFILVWNKSGKETIALTVLHEDLVNAVEGERQMFLNVPEYISKEEDQLLLKLLGTLELDPVLYDELLIHLKSNDYKSARLLHEESNKRIEEMDLLNQRMYGIFWPCWKLIFDKIEGPNQAEVATP